ncbi:uncharacterized protein UDID_17111 [Ustilago sp. UG-2017a]|nr:uncharacterized protein UDID_17111 [Ustilago sp. UG-2017a]
MAGESNHQASTSEAARRTKGGKRGKTTQRVQIDEEVTNDNKAKEESDSGNDDNRYDYRTLAKILETVPKLTSRNYYSWCTLIKANLRVVPYATRHLEGKYNRSHPKWNRTFDNALVGVLRSTLDTEGEHNVLHLLLDISKNHLTFHQAWKKIERSLTSEAARILQWIALLAQLNKAKMFHADAHKLIQEIRAMQTETSLLGAPFSDDALYAVLQRCTIRHPVYKETVATVHQVSFDALATALTTRQSAMESVPGQKVDPRQASARTAGTNEEQAYDAESDMGSARTAVKPKRIRCWEVWCSFTPSWQQLPKSGETTCWILDSGASYHMVNNHSMLIHPRNCRKHVYTTGSEVLEATAVGDVSIATEYGDVYLQNVLYVKRLNVNLLSTNSLTDEGARVTLDPTGRQIHLANGMLLKVAKDRKRGLLEFRGDTWRQSAMTISTPLFEGVDEEFELANQRPKISTKQLWHERLGHPGRDKSRAIVDKLKGEPVIALDPDMALTCEQCIQSKSTVARMGPLDLIHIDLIIDSSHVTEYTCTLVLVDDYSNHTFMQLKRIVSFLETQTDRKLKAIQSDQGTEWKSNEALEWSLSKGIEWQTTVGYNSRQNGRVEQMNRSLAAAFKLNLTPSVDGEFPYQLMFGKSPERFIRLMCVFGCLAWVNVPKAKRNNKKLDQRAVTAIFLGYSLERKGWLFYSPNYAPNIFWSNSARFMETQCWSDRSEWRPMSIRPPPVPTVEEDLDDLGYTEENLFDEREQEPLEEYVDMESALEEEELEVSRIEDKAPNEGPKEREEYTPVPPEKRGPWSNWRPARNMRNPETWVKRSYCGLTAARAEEGKKNLNPTVRKALAGEDRRFWEEAMRKELDGLEVMGTWEITDLPRGMNTVDTQWVLKIKTDTNMIPTKYKARLVARGFTQREGLDYAEIFAPVAPIKAIRGVLAIVAVHDWEVDSIDVKQAYLNSSLHHNVYLKPPVGTRIPPGKVLKLVKGLYGLKQSGRKWNIELDSHLRKIGFHCMPSAPCLYSRGVGKQLTVITAYVDDMLIVSPQEVDRTKAEIMDKWGTEDNGPRKQGKISLDLIAYIKSMVSKWLEGPNERTWIPMQSVMGAARGDKCAPDQAKQYQELVGQLLWVSNTVRPDISFAVGTLARYMSEPIDSAWKAAIHLLKYLNQTNDYHLNLGGLHRNHAGQPVVTYTNANWASDPTNGHRSTSGAITYVYGCPVSWKSHPLKGLSTTKASRMIGLDMPLRRGVEDTPALSRRDVLDQNTHDWEIGKTPSDKEDEIDAKLVGAHAAYARGLTPWYAGGMIT